MQKRKIGNTTLHVSPLMLGCNVFGWTIDQKTSFEILDAFLHSGFEFLDTADIYAKWATGKGGESETIIGNWMRARKNRSKVIIATKAGMTDLSGGINITKKYILNAVEGSLKRLGTDHIDLYQTHRDDEKVPVEETLEAHAQLVKEGKVRYIGASNFFAERLTKALNASKKNGWPRYETLQPLYNLYDREVFERELMPICMKENVSVINYYSLAAGFLSGKYRTQNDLLKSQRGPRVERYMNERGLKILDALDKEAHIYNCSLSTIAIAWLLTRPCITAPIASATSIEQLDQLIAATRLKLSDDSIRDLNNASEWSQAL